MKLTAKDIAEISHKYSVGLAPMAALAREYGVTRQAIWKALRRSGVDTKKGSATQIETTCEHCGKVYNKVRCQYRSRKANFCSADCYYGHLSGGSFTTGGKYNGDRQGQRIARKVISPIIPLKAGWVVHHRDRNTNNNDIGNLMVFRSQAEHMRYHRGGDAQPILDGRDTLTAWCPAL